ncbi:recombinase family protein [Streptomyces sp. NBRC 110611]|uniref:recombinase family protein n=1 Tax=Streptomyces sp. NBRC 110611 TaxID=1621259 RepID=UPI0011BE2E99|nr:recombinase family protein [Streptomyces sp. NBRC 110611]
MSTITSQEPVPAIGYIRVSTWREEKISPELQKKTILEWARRHNRIIVRWIPDLDKTGRNFKRRIMEAIVAVEKQEAREIAVWKYSRFGRTRHGVAINLARVNRVGGELQSATEEVDATTAAGKFHRGMLFEVAAFESDRAGEQWKETHDWRREHGLPAAGGRRAGYTWHRRIGPDDKPQEERYEPNDAGPAYGGLFLRYVNGEGYMPLTNWLNHNGYKNTRGKPWTHESLRWYMDSGFAAGLLHVHRPDTCQGLEEPCKKRAHYIHIPGAHKPLIGLPKEGEEKGEEEQAEEAKAIWDAYLLARERTKKTPPRARQPKYPLAGLTWCGVCEASRAGVFNAGDTSNKYRCKAYERDRSCTGAYVRRSYAEEKTYEWLQSVAGEVDANPAPLPEVEEGKPDLKKVKAQLDARLLKVQAGIDNANTLHALGDLDRDEFLRTKATLKKQREKIEKQLSELEFEEVKAEGAAPYLPAVRNLLEEWDTLPVSVVRGILASLIDRVHMFPGPHIEITPVWTSERWSSLELTA